MSASSRKCLFINYLCRPDRANVSGRAFAPSDAKVPRTGSNVSDDSYRLSSRYANAKLGIVVAERDLALLSASCTRGISSARGDRLPGQEMCTWTLDWLPERAFPPPASRLEVHPGTGRRFVDILPSGTRTVVSTAVTNGATVIALAALSIRARQNQ